MNIEEIERLAFIKYKLSGKKAMNTYIFTQISKNKIADEEIDKIIESLNEKVKIYEQEKKQKVIEQVAFTCNILGKVIK
jgi:hypothetical protein